MWFWNSPRTRAFKLIGIIVSSMNTVKYFDERIRNLEQGLEELEYKTGRSRIVYSAQEKEVKAEILKNRLEDDKAVRASWLNRITKNQAKLGKLLEKYPFLNEDETLKRDLNSKGALVLKKEPQERFELPTS